MDDPTLDPTPTPTPTSQRTASHQSAASSTEGSNGLPSAPPGYEILGELGRGGMGVVYHARHIRLNRPVALKVVLTGAHASSDDRVRFLAEAEAVAALNHPGIVQDYDFGTHDDVPYLALEYCSGGTLAGRLRGTPLPPRDAATIVEQLARAVQAAHDRGIVHRDLKPANVLLVNRSADFADDADSKNNPSAESAKSVDQFLPKITDFGLVKRIEGGAGLTATGAILGTPSYMAPEQAGNPKAVGPPADIYALGAILYECLTGRPPFRAATPVETVLQVRELEPVSVRSLNPQVPADLETVCLNCLRKEPAKRFPTAGALADDLHSFLDHRPIKARPVNRLERVWKWAKRNKSIACLGASLAAVIVGSTVALGLMYLRAEDQRHMAQKAYWDVVSARVESISKLANLLEARGMLAETEVLYREILREEEQAFRDPEGDTPDWAIRTLSTHSTLCELLMRQGKLDEAESLLRERLNIVRRVGTIDVVMTMQLNQLGFCLSEKGEGIEAEELLRESLALWQKIAKDIPGAAIAVPVAATESLLGSSLVVQGRYTEAEPLLLKSYQVLFENGVYEDMEVPAAQRVPRAAKRLVKLYEAWGRPSELAKWRAVAASLDAKKPTPAK